jgi:hypothetical protein
MPYVSARENEVLEAAGYGERVFKVFLLEYLQILTVCIFHTILFSSEKFIFGIQAELFEPIYMFLICSCNFYQG